MPGSAGLVNASPGGHPSPDALAVASGGGGLPGSVGPVPVSPAGPSATPPDLSMAQLDFSPAPSVTELLRDLTGEEFDHW